jgi:type IV pilus assembly protein PilB
MQPYGAHKKIGEILVSGGSITGEELNSALEDQNQGDDRIGEILVMRHLISEKEVAKALSVQSGLVLVDLKEAVPSPEALLCIPEALARRYVVFPLACDHKKITLVMADGGNYEVMQILSFFCGREISPLLAPRTSIIEAIARHYGLGSWAGSGMDPYHGSSLGDGRFSADESRGWDSRGETGVGKKGDTPPIIRLADTILKRGIETGASDIHMEPFREHFSIRLRVDGVLVEEMRLPIRVQAGLVSRFKVLARLDISEKRLPQDGALSLRLEGRAMDLRISTLPTQHGEKVALRILDSTQGVVSLERLGLWKEDHKRVEVLIRRRRGIIFVTGPTGSGKTTTLYAMMQKIRSVQINIVTVEDPVEYNMPGLNQIQVRPDIGLGFPQCLRAILRQDPDVILVGEIRDGETAEIALRAAMTGHLVLTTLHTGDAVSTIMRLVDLGIPRYVVASTVTGIVAQRLVRRVCLQCQGGMRVSAPSATPHRGGRECSACRNEGFSGRTGLFEVLVLNDPLRDLIASGLPEKELRREAAVTGMTTLMEDGLRKISTGVTTYEEVRRMVDE